MVALTAAVRRGLNMPLLVGDPPFGTYEISDEQAVETAHRFVEAGADVVKLERAGTSASRAAAIVESGVPVMGHIGVTPQTEVTWAGAGRPAQGRTPEATTRLLCDG